MVPSNALVEALKREREELMRRQARIALLLEGDQREPGGSRGLARALLRGRGVAAE